MTLWVALLTLLGLLGLLVGGTWLAIRLVKKYTAEKLPAIPDQILTDFSEVERRYKEANGSKTHQQILWEYARERDQRTGSSDSGRQPSPGTKGSVSTSPASDGDIQTVRSFIRGQDIPVRATDTTGSNQREPEQPDHKTSRKPKIDWSDFG